MTILLVRHGETPFHADNRYVGSTDVALTERGHAQARELAGWGRTAGLSALVSSPMRRAYDTAAPVAAAAGISLRTDDRWRELAFGQGDGLTAQEMHKRFPMARSRFEADPFRNPLPGGEDPAAALARSRQAFDELAGAGAVSGGAVSGGAVSGGAVSDRGTVAGRVLVVAHSTLLRILLCDLIGLDPGRYREVYPGFGNATGAVLHRTVAADGTGRIGLRALNPALRAGEPAW